MLPILEHYRDCVYGNGNTRRKPKKVKKDRTPQIIKDLFSPCKPKKIPFTETNYYKEYIQGRTKF